MKILVVDDSRAMRMIVKRTLSQTGYANAKLFEAQQELAKHGAVLHELHGLLLIELLEGFIRGREERHGAGGG